MDYNKILNKHLFAFTKEILNDVIINGFDGDAHLVITFCTRHHDVVLAQKLREAYPDELTVILDEEFYNLSTHDTGFSVQLVFDDYGMDDLFIPYASLIAIEDPSSDFMVEFEPDLGDIDTQNQKNVIHFSDIRKKK